MNEAELRTGHTKEEADKKIRGSWELRAQPGQSGFPGLMEGGLAWGWVSEATHRQGLI